MAQKLLDQGQLPEAKLLLEQVCKTDRQDSEGWYGLGIVNGMIGDFATARDCFENVVRLKPDMARAHINLAKAFVGMGQYDAAVAAYRAALNITPGDLDTHRYLNATLVRMGRLEDAMAGYDRMLALTPDNPDLLAAKAKIFEIRGDKKRAYEQLGPLIERYPKNPKIAVAFAAVCKEVGKCDDAIRMLESILANPESRLHPEIECEIRFALGNLYDDRKDYDKAFGHYLHANRIKGRTFDIANFTRHIDDVIRTFTAEALQRSPQSTIPTGTAVFIVGMPRSGTSLVEQILASHPQVAAGGELHDFANLVIEIPALVDTRHLYPRYLNDLTVDICNTVAQRYLDRLGGISATSRYVTNKMPQNFLYLGLISRILPQARIIHCRRDSRDTCVSCFFQDFTDGHGYCYDLETLGAYYRQYQRLMAHWEQVIDRPIHTVQYEELVADQENQTRRLLAFLDLPWDDDCLQFHTSKRLIQTASYDQVRQPLYRKSAGRWKNYERHLLPLMKGLGS